MSFPLQRIHQLAFLLLLLPAAAGAQALEPAPAESAVDAAWPVAKTGGPQTRTVRVDCSRRSITEALERRAEELIIEFEGVCTENVVVRRDNVTLRGVEGGRIVGRLDVLGGQGVTLADFAIEGGAGIIISDRALVRVENVTSTRSTGNGLSVFASTVRINGLVVDDNNAFGLRIDRGSQGELAGTLSASRNRIWGVIISGNSLVTGFGFNLTATGNGNAGLGIQLSSSVQFNNGTILANQNLGAGFILQLKAAVSLVGMTLEANNNAGSGWILASLSNLVEGRNNVKANNNGASGLVMGEGATWVNFFATGSTWQLNNNPEFGLRGDLSSIIDLRGPNSNLSTVNNGRIGVVLLNSTGRFENLTATGNPEMDMLVDFGSRGSLFGDANAITTLHCGAGSVIDVDAVFADTGRILICDPDNPVINERRRSLEPARPLDVPALGTIEAF